MIRLRALFLLVVVVLMLQPQARSHERSTDPVLAELNDYLMALQILRFHDARAGELFKEWQSVREASWKIRELTHDRDLPVQDAAVQQQIAQSDR